MQIELRITTKPICTSVWLGKVFQLCLTSKNVIFVGYLVVTMSIFTACGSKHWQENEASTAVSQAREARKLEWEGDESGSVSQRFKAHGFPRLANQILDCCPTHQNEEVFRQIHFWDLVVLNSETLYTNPEYFGPEGIIRSENPNAILLAYFSAGDVLPANKRRLSAEFQRGLEQNWFLRDPHGNVLRLFQLKDGKWTLALNLATALKDYMSKFLSENIMNTDGADGIFFDWTLRNISWLNHAKSPRQGPIDIDNNGRADSDRKVDQLWSDGFVTMVENCRKLFPKGAIISGNAGWQTDQKYASVLNGIMIEQFLKGAPFEYKSFGWAAQMRTYAYYTQVSVKPHFSLIMVNDDNRQNFKKLRFSLASALMFNGYFCFTNETLPYGKAWWYDEYSVDPRSGIAAQKLDYKGYLGKPLGPAFNAEEHSERLEEVLYTHYLKAEDKIWERDFENGIVLVNPQKKTRLIRLNGSFRKIRGTIDPSFNDGSVVNQVSLEPRSGVILLRPVSEIRPLSH